MKPITKTALIDLNKIIQPSDLQKYVEKYQRMMQQYNIFSGRTKQQSIIVDTPSTVDSMFRRSGCAISRSRKDKGRGIINRSKDIITQTYSNKAKINDNRNIIDTQQQEHEEYTHNNQSQLSIYKNQQHRKILTDKAVYYGQVQLPYLHSSDAISSLYAKSKKQQFSEPLLNPPSNVSSHLLTSVKNLYLYYTGIDSLRQLGTGWSGLKSLTIMCSIQLKDLSGLSIFPSIQNLFVPHNSISDISDLMYHSSLSCIDLDDNKIQLMDQIQYIYTINQLEWVDINNNPITKQRQKYRIIAENLGNKLEPEQFNKDEIYMDKAIKLEYEIFSYQNICETNYVISECNKQTVDDEIKVGSVWRKIVAEKNDGQNNQDEQKEKQSESQFVTYSEVMPQDQESDPLTFLQNQIENKEEYVDSSNNCNFSFTPLQCYIEPQLNVQLLKKYFYNKVCPQNGQRSQQMKSIKKRGLKMLNKESIIPKQKNDGQQESKIQTDSMQNKKQHSIINAHRFGATQNLPRTHHQGISQQKQKRQTSLSFNKKKLKKLSLPKNVHRVTSTQLSNSSTPLNLLKSVKGQKTDFFNSNNKLLGKRRIIASQSNALNSGVNNQVSI